MIYLDNNATTRPSEEVIQAMLPYLREWYGNPSSVHRFGQQARRAIDQARGEVAELIGCRPGELIFTGGGTESINTAIRGLLEMRAPRKTIVTSTVEHSATGELCRKLQKEGARVVEVPVNGEGMIDLAALEGALGDDVALVSLILANNETGVIFPGEQIGNLCAQRGIPLHMDITQAVGKVPVEVGRLGLAAASFAAHKFHGPKGVGGLFLKTGRAWGGLIVGGPQERGRRGGTENVPGIVGMGKAAEMARQTLPQMSTVAEMRDRFERDVVTHIPESRINGAGSPRIPNTTNIGFARLEAEAILLLLSEQGICASAGAACSSGSLEPSHVLQAMGVDRKYAHGSIRFSLSRYTTPIELEQTMKTLPKVVEKLRQVLPVA
jgi:cysteine desulfurase